MKTGPRPVNGEPSRLRGMAGLLGNGLDADRNLTAPAMQRGWECLARFGERLAGFLSWLRANGKKGFVGELAGPLPTQCAPP